MMEGMEDSMREAALEQLASAEQGVRDLPKSKERVKIGKLVGEMKEMSAEADSAQIIIITTFAVATNEAVADGDLSSEEIEALQEITAKMRETL
jgi:hypothetical protein